MNKMRERRVAESKLYLQSSAIGPNEPLPSLHKALSVANHIANLYDVAVHVVLQDSQRLKKNVHVLRT